ncbi:5-oxoprolinase subunit PxpB [Lysobacter sp. BMK333-48F3]|uniref:5-oxoprolinase subunit PxpB n=1 Tax=Lysobacter sp. BMK333-48F3 TaxID=2867962 RepID=UPI001C8CBB6E|nr:5-oxoprolinase subunit PxpB [Lysobacter sp. BMK333-48F3]MBX9403638.1 5-oxoprolinase subunit PxpB [Lysobacter sp. BMK333-48F3]
MPPPPAVFEPLADDAWLLRLGERIDDAVNARVHAFVARLRRQPPPWLRDLVPAYASLALFFDPRIVDAETALDWLSAQWLSHDHDLADGPVEALREVEIPVAYGGEYGPDLDESAAELGLSPQQLIQRHADAEYRVAMIGFAPGFPYLSGLDPALALPRLSTPRTAVAAGSVAIGGAQTGIYPRPGPGGWRLLGRTPLALFDAGRAAPTLLLPGDRVRFVPIDADAFERLRAQATP